ncbi:MAG TPA: type II toxin-antitoxin system RelE/ParE family toxin [Intrasporangiaceae bacterium]|nr:type II toxin-antitoxin system RelE/ParE family toxin [Intrasporangiaceae bacterium]
MPASYEIAWTPTSKRSLQRLPEKVATAAVEFIYGTLATNPQRVGKALRFDLEGLHSARRGDYRIIYRIDDRVTIIAIEHRADAYPPTADGPGTAWP